MAPLLNLLAEAALAFGVGFVCINLLRGYRDDATARSLADGDEQVARLAPEIKDRYDTLRLSAETSRQIATYQKPWLLWTIVIATGLKVLLAVVALVPAERSSDAVEIGHPVKRDL